MCLDLSRVAGPGGLIPVSARLARLDPADERSIALKTAPASSQCTVRCSFVLSQNFQILTKDETEFLPF